ncbi:TRAP transporter small permease [Spirabiliibacterium falconis]|uniref:TRAP transporter small permease n=1 Tax=Spirabiliibacterium falconis TaxID=572023 RepID=UPI001AADD368|nr:TRAP transporter small permease [Spirabiliibacterium falconis]MBE2894893.1 TRAP transporter small permease [Spirabiliibacterium falconis]
MKISEIFFIIEKFFEPFFIVLSVGLLTILVFLMVGLRPFDISIAWFSELSRYMFVWAIYLGISYAIRDERHIRVTLFLDLLPYKLQQFLLMLADIVFMLYSIIVAYFGYLICIKSISLGQIAPAMEISVVFLYASVVISAVLCVLRLAPKIAKKVKLILSQADNNKHSIYHQGEL